MEGQPHTDARRESSPVTPSWLSSTLEGQRRRRRGWQEDRRRWGSSLSQTNGYLSPPDRIRRVDLYRKVFNRSLIDDRDREVFTRVC
jgi:hypothetical protein